MREGEILEDEYYVHGMRSQRTYLLVESELSAMVWSPWWVRRAIAKHIRASTTFPVEDAQAIEAEGGDAETGPVRKDESAVGPKADAPKD